MIREITIRRFKRFDDVTFRLPGHIVLAGPNNTGKTTVLQAVAAWSLAFDTWLLLHDLKRRGGGYTRAPVARQAFSAVPLRSFDLLWNERRYQGAVEIGVRTDEANVVMEFIADSTEQIYVRPTKDVDPQALRVKKPQITFVPPMTGLSNPEPIFQQDWVNNLLGQGKPGDVLRNLINEAHNAGEVWQLLLKSIRRLFGYELMPPEAVGGVLVAEYRQREGGPRLDIASAGSGFQQVLMLLTFLHTRPASVLLLDEPDAHLHVILQDTIYSELRSVAAEHKSQLIVATHSEVIINSVDPMELYALFDQPRPLADTAERQRLCLSLGTLDNIDIMVALAAPGVLYTEDYTDIDILREWARILNHPMYDALNTRIMVRKIVAQARPDGAGIKARDHYEALKLIRPDLPGVELVDGDAHPGRQTTPPTEGRLRRLRWRRYEVESYLVHPAALERFVEHTVGEGEASAEARRDMLAYLERTFTPAFLADPLPAEPNPLIEAYFEQRKARTEVLPPILTAAGLPGFPYTRYHEIAAVMYPEEIHPEVREKLDAIQQAFGL